MAKITKIDRWIQKGKFSVRVRTYMHNNVEYKTLREAKAVQKAAAYLGRVIFFDEIA